jgi:D-alanyl-D-alanine carboxypeptidase
MAAAALCVTASTADASLRHHRHHAVHSSEKSNGNDDSTDAGGKTSGRYADFVVDAKTGRVLHETNADAPRHPASLTKMMTLYILFEELERGRFTMDSELTVSRHAASQSPTKLDLRPGETISVSDAIHGLVTQSANDAAVTIAENIAGSEDAFAHRMTQTAHRIGMNNTYFYNASGLPNSNQYTTAHDMVTLGRALQERFPENYKVFATRSFAYNGRVYGNHNHLLGRLDGIDGIKTGYTDASGFNLVTSIHRDGHFVVAAVMGGSSAGSRDQQMVRLVEAHLPDSSTGPHIASVFTDVRMAARDGDEKPTAPIAVPALHGDKRADGSRVDVAQVETVRNTLDTVSKGRPAPTVATAVLDPAVEGEAKPVKPRAASRTAEHPAAKVDDRAASLIMAKAISIEQKKRQVVASLDNFIPAAPAGKPAVVKVETVPIHLTSQKSDDNKPKSDDRPKPDDHAERLMTASVEPAHTADKRIAETAKEHSTMPPVIHDGWLIQIAAVDTVNDAKSILQKARTAAGEKLAAQTPVAEPFSKGGATLYRARFSGFTDQKTANAACNSLKRKEFACLVIRQ